MPNKDHRKVIKKAVGRGWTITHGGGGHLKLRSPAGRLVITSSTPSSRSAMRALAGDIARVERAERELAS